MLEFNQYILINCNQNYASLGRNNIFPWWWIMILASPSNGIYTRPCVVSNSVVQQCFFFFLVPCYLQYIVQRRRSTIQRCNHCVTEIDFYYSTKLPNNVTIITIVYLLLLLSLLHRKKCSTIEAFQKYFIHDWKVFNWKK